MTMIRKMWRVWQQQGLVALGRTVVQRLRQMVQRGWKVIAKRLWRNPRWLAQRMIRQLRDVQDIVFILSGVPLDDTGGGSRCTQLALEFLRQGVGVIFINQFPKQESRQLDLAITHPHLFTYALADFDWAHFRAACLSQMLDKHLVTLVEFPSREFLPLVLQLREYGSVIVYDLIDDWNTTLGGAWYTSATEQQIIQASDVRVATAPILVERLERQSGQPVLLLPNAVNTSLFDPQRAWVRPADLPLAEWTAIYTGALWGDWFDWDLLKQIAASFPHASIVVIGDYRGQAGSVPANLHFLGLKAQRDLPAYLAHSNVAIIPWKINAITHATSPLKVYEYLAMHRPVVAPAIHPLRNVPGVWCAKDALDFIAKLTEARQAVFPIAQVDAFICQNNWQVRVRELMQYVQAHPRYALA
jgi:hypothetical protein